MTILARADHAGGQFCGSVDQGCCGQVHPYVINASGFPSITCANGCEDFLRHDPLHKMLASEVPETYDEKTTREDWEKRGAADQQYIQAMVMAKAFGLEIPDSFARLGTGGRKALPGAAKCPAGHEVRAGNAFCGTCGASMTADLVRCKDGHANDPSEKFCGDCGVPMGDLVPGAVIPDVPRIAAPAAPKPAARRKPLKDYRHAELQAMAKARGLSGEGVKADIIARLRAAK